MTLMALKRPLRKALGARIMINRIRKFYHHPRISVYTAEESRSQSYHNAFSDIIAVCVNKI